jgi:hypothetical protein
MGSKPQMVVAPQIVPQVDVDPGAFEHAPCVLFVTCVEMGNGISSYQKEATRSGRCHSINEEGS